MRKTKVLCFANNKGGSGKSTSCAGVGYGISTMGYKVLLIDGDMQLNLSLSFFSEEQVLEYAKGDKNLYQALKNGRDLKECTVHTAYENLDIIPSSILMSSIEYELFARFQRELVLKKGLKTILEQGLYDFILIDSPPTLGGWVMNIMCASQFLVIPAEASPWGMFGIGNMFEFLQEAFQINEKLQVLGIFFTKVDTRKNYFRQTRAALQGEEGLNVFDTFIRINSEIEWAQDNNAPITAYKKSSRGAKEYMTLTKEILAKLEQDCVENTTG